MVDQGAVFILGDDETFGIFQLVDQIEALFITENHNGGSKSVRKSAGVRQNRYTDNAVIHRESDSGVYDMGKAFVIDLKEIPVISARCKTFIVDVNNLIDLIQRGVFLGFVDTDSPFVTVFSVTGRKHLTPDFHELLGLGRRRVVLASP